MLAECPQSRGQPDGMLVRTGWGGEEQRVAHTGIHFPLTTAQQRRLLFETWEATGKVAVACQTAHVGERTFYYWKRRCGEGGYAALEHFASCVPTHTRRTGAEVEAQVITLHQQQPGWGKQRLADELAKGNGWVPLCCPNTVKRILRDAGLWDPPRAPAKKGDPRG
jgi:Homeodomain-like domain